MYKVEGQIKQINNLQKLEGDTGLNQVQTMILETKDKYPQNYLQNFGIKQQKLLSQYKVGDTVTVSMNVNSNKWKDRFFVKLKGFKIETGNEVTNTEQNPDRNIEVDLPF